MIQQGIRKRFISIGLAALLLISCLATIVSMPSTVLAATQATYYVSPTGNDTNPGTLAAPFQTLTRARDVVRTINTSMTGDIIVYLRGGNYPLTSTVSFGPSDSGTNNYKVIYQAYPNETPVLNGGTQVTGWTLDSGSIYKATLTRGKKLRALYVNDKRAVMTSKVISSAGGYGTYSVTAGQAPWAWISGTQSDGVMYDASQFPAIASNQDDLEIKSSMTWNENIVSVRSLTTSGSNRVALFQEPYGAIAQQPSWGTAFNVGGTHVIYNAYEFLNTPGQFYYNKSTSTLYYYKRANENMSTATVYAPQLQTLIDLAGTSTTNRVKNITFKGLTFANSDWNLQNVAGSTGKATLQGATVATAYADGNWHNDVYRAYDTMPAAVQGNNIESVSFLSNTVKHTGADGIGFINDIKNVQVTGNTLYDVASSSITLGHPQHAYIGDGGTHEKFAPGIEGAPINDTISNNYVKDSGVLFAGSVPITIFFTNGLNLTHNLIDGAPYSGISMGWGWNVWDGTSHSMFPGNPSTVAFNNHIEYNRIQNVMSVLGDGGAIYTLGNQPNSTIVGNYIENVGTGYAHAIHPDGGSAYITGTNNVFYIAPNLNAFELNEIGGGDKHDNHFDTTYSTSPNNNTMCAGCSITNFQVNSYPNPSWSPAAQTIISNAGLEPAYQNLVKLQAEDATLSNAASFNNDHQDYSGGGFVDGYWNLGAKTTFNVNVPLTQNYNVTLRYGNALNPNGTVSIYVNGTKIKQTSLPMMANWDTWGTKTETLALVAGNNTISYQYDSGDTGYVNLDYINVAPIVLPQTIIEAESGTLLGRGASYADAAASGGVAVQYLDAVGDGIQFNSVPAATQITIKYASQFTGTYGLYINGVRTTFSFIPSGAWSGSYIEKTIPVNIPAGATVKLQSASGDSGLNVDKITLVYLPQTVLEAESATMLGRAVTYADGAASGGSAVQNIDAVGDGIQFNSVPAATQISIRYSSQFSGTYGLYINGVRTTFSFIGNGTWSGAYVDKLIPITIPAGATVKLQKEAGDSALNVDKITLQ